MMTMIKTTKWWWWWWWWWWCYQLSCELENDFLYSFFFLFLYFILSSLSLHSYHDPFIDPLISSFIRFDDDIIPFIDWFIFILLNIKIFIHKKMMKSFIFHLIWWQTKFHFTLNDFLCKTVFSLFFHRSSNRSSNKSSNRPRRCFFILIMLMLMLFILLFIIELIVDHHFLWVFIIWSECWFWLEFWK